MAGKLPDCSPTGDVAYAEGKKHFVTDSIKSMESRCLLKADMHGSMRAGYLMTQRRSS